MDCDSINLSIDTTCTNFTEPDPFHRNIVTNTNQNSPAYNVVLIDELAKGIAYDRFVSSGVAGTVSCSGDGLNPETVTCTLDVLQDGETWTLDIYVDDNTVGPSPRGHEVSVSADNVEAYVVDNEDACSTATVPVSLAYFKAERTGSTVHFSWTTASEVSNVGFNLFSISESGTRRLNNQLIASQQTDSMTPAHYTFEASGVKGDRFIIEDVDVFATRRQHGAFDTGIAFGSKEMGDPIDWNSIRAEDDQMASEREVVALAETSIRLDQIVAENDGLSFDMQVEPSVIAGAKTESLSKAAPRKGLKSLLVNPRTARLSIASDGMVRVTYEQLFAAGIDLRNIDGSQLALINRGAPVPVHVVAVDGKFGPGSSIEFYGEAVDSLYTRTNAYDLIVDGSRRKSIGALKSPSKLSGTPATSYIETLTVNNNRSFSPSAPIDDPWIDIRMLVYTTQNSWSIPVAVDNLEEGASTLKLRMWGGLDWDTAVEDHHFRAELNGEPIIDHRFGGITAYEPEVTLTSDVLLEGENSLDLILMGDTGVAYDLMNFDSFELLYPRAFVARDGQLTFSAAAPLFKVTNLTSPDVVVYRFVDGMTPVRYDSVLATRQPDGTFTASFTGAFTMARYHVLSSAPAAPAAIEPMRDPGSIATTATDYLVIAHPNFIGGIQPLVDHHRANGLRVKVVDVRDVYDAYGDGIFDPLAIKTYISDAKANSVRFVLLVGGDTYDYQNNAFPDAMSFIPTLYARTSEFVNHAPVDAQLADVDNNGVPDLAIGRFPVRTTAELDAVVGKTLAYAGKTYGRTGLFAADVGEPSISFASDSDSFIEQLAGGWSVERAYIDEIGVAEARARTLAKINEGVALSSFVGHSSTTAWTASGLFRSSDAAALTNAGRPTVVTQWGCWNTFFVSPSYNSLGHGFMVSGDRGAAAVLGASALTEARSEQLLGALIMPRLTEPGATIGEAVLAAKQALAIDHPYLADVLLGWTILGDPALQVEP